MVWNSPPYQNFFRVEKHLVDNWDARKSLVTVKMEQFACGGFAVVGKLLKSEIITHIVWRFQ